MPLVVIIFVSLLSVCAGYDDIRNQNEAEKKGVQRVEYPLPLPAPTTDREYTEFMLKKADRDPWDCNFYPTIKHGSKNCHNK
jgi:hypothetical protein